MNNGGPRFKCLNELGPREEVLRDVQEEEREWQQNYLHYVSNHEAQRCPVRLNLLCQVINRVKSVHAHNIHSLD